MRLTRCMDLSQRALDRLSRVDYFSYRQHSQFYTLSREIKHSTIEKSNEKRTEFQKSSGGNLSQKQLVFQRKKFIRENK